MRPTVLVVAAAIAGILLFLLATASANTPLFARNYTLLLGLNGVIALVLSVTYRLLAKAAPLETLQAMAPLVVLAVLVAAQLAASLLFHLVEEPVRRAVTARLGRAGPRRSPAAGLHEPVL